MNIFKQIDSWFTNEDYGYEPFFNNWLYFNSTPYISGSVAMNTVPGDSLVRKFVDGSKYKQLILAIDFIKNYDPDGTSDVNIDIMEELDKFNSWVDDRNKLKQYPNIGTNKKIDRLTVISDIPSMLIDPTQMLSKYQIQIKFEYYDESEVIK